MFNMNLLYSYLIIHGKINLIPHKRRGYDNE
jgi:hypothetical protein